jgi:hypothetical protein
VDPERWNRLKDIFTQALDRPPAEREVWAVSACAGDEGLVQEIGALLAAHDSDPLFLETPAPLDPEDLVAPAGLDEGTSLEPGTVLGDRQYRILGEAGRGGMAIVYVAEDLRLPRRVAMKALPGLASLDPMRLERFRREAWAAAKISHPAVATVYAFEKFGGQSFIVCELVRGRTLAAEIRQGAIEPARAKRIAIDIARGLCAAHEQGVVHRDLKPDNVMLTEDGSVKVLDFGIAQLERSETPALTREGTWLGTPAYMAPEQREGSTVDARADIYSFGVVLSEMLTGRHPLSGTSPRPPGAQPSAGGRPATAAGTLTAGTTVAGPLGSIVQRCLQLDPAARYNSARELLQALEQVRIPEAADEARGRTPRWWWEFHQVATVIAGALSVVAAWHARNDVHTVFSVDANGRRAAAAFFVVVLASVIVSGSLRLNLWFTSRLLPDQLPHVRLRNRVWIRAADWTFVVALLSAGLLILERNANEAFLLLAIATGIAVVSSLIEPATERAAFEPPTPSA